MKRKIIFLIIVSAFILTGCQHNMEGGQIIESRIIYPDSPFTGALQEGFFNGVLVWPIAQFINLLSKPFGAVLAVVSATVMFQIITWLLGKLIDRNNAKTAKSKDELEDIRKRYEGRTDSESRQKMTEELRDFRKKYSISPVWGLLLGVFNIVVIYCMHYAVQRASGVVNGTVLGVRLATTPQHAFANLNDEWPVFIIYGIMCLSQVASVLLATLSAKVKAVKKINYVLLPITALVMIYAWKWTASVSLYWASSQICGMIKTIWMAKRRKE